MYGSRRQGSLVYYRDAEGRILCHNSRGGRSRLHESRLALRVSTFLTYVGAPVRRGRSYGNVYARADTSSSALDVGLNVIKSRSPSSYLLLLCKRLEWSGMGVVTLDCSLDGKFYRLVFSVTLDVWGLFAASAGLWPG